MEEKYPVYLEEETVGKIVIRTNGLYASCLCHCHGRGNTIYRLVAAWDGGWENLGIPVPEGDGLVLSKSIPAKRLEKEPMEYRLIPSAMDVGQALRSRRQEEPESEGIIPEKPAPEEVPPSEPVPGEAIPEEPAQEEILQQEPLSGENTRFVPIGRDFPFPDLDKLENAKLCITDTAVGALIPDQSAMESPTGQWSEPSTSE